MIRHLVIVLLLSGVVLAQPAPPTPSEREAGFLFRQGLELLEDDQVSRAVDLFKRSLRLEPERLEVRPYLARGLFLEGDYEAALRQLDLYLNAEPADSKVALFRVKTLVALERLGQARDALEYLRSDLRDSSWEWHNLRGFLLESEGEAKEAESEYLKAAELAGAASYEPKTNLIALWLEQERVEEATELVGEMLSEAAKDPQVLNAFALLLARKERGFDPSPILEAVKDKETPFELQYNLAAALAERNELEQAALLAADLVDQFPDEPRASWIYGRILLQRRELAEAGDYLLAVRDKIPTSAETIQTLGIYSYLMGDYEESAQWFRQAVERSPESSEALHNLSMALIRLDELEEATKVSRKAVELSSEDPRLVYQLALVLDRDGEIQEASKMYRRFLELNDDPAKAAVVREHLAEMEGDMGR